MLLRLLVLLVTLLASACTGNQSVLNPQGPAAHSIAQLIWFTFGICGAVYLAVMAALWWSIARRRRETDDEARTSVTLTRSVAFATALTTIALVGLTVASVIAGHGLTSPSGPGAVTVDVIGHQWWWDFRYHDVTPSEWVTSPNELHIPVGVSVVLRVQTNDVIHSFWVPNLQGKRDLIPGQVTELWMQADQAGVYRGQCAEFCGMQHAHMAFLVVAEPRDQFLTWLQQQRRPAVEPDTDAARHGREIFVQSECVKCHAIRGTGATAQAGPELTHVGARLTLASATLPNTRGHLAGWIANAQSIKPGNLMPPNMLASADLQDLLTYLRTLR